MLLWDSLIVEFRRRELDRQKPVEQSCTISGSIVVGVPLLPRSHRALQLPMTTPSKIFHQGKALSQKSKIPLGNSQYRPR
jgi:hypothetical protein